MKDIKAKFERFKKQWEEETMLSSSIQVYHPAYQKIVELGPDVIPYVLEDMKKDPNWLCGVLQLITGEDLISNSCQGDLKAITEIWLKWGRDQGLIE